MLPEYMRKWNLHRAALVDLFGRCDNQSQCENAPILALFAT